MTQEIDFIYSNNEVVVMGRGNPASPYTISLVFNDTYRNPGEPGSFPFTRGPYRTMYCQKPWTIRQYSGFSTASETNKFFKRNLAEGQTGLSVAFDLPTHRGYDSDHPAVAPDVGKAGVSIDTVDDFKELFEGIPLDKVSVSMTMNGAVIPIMAFYIVTAEEQGIPPSSLSGTIQNDIIKEFMVRNTYIYPPEPSMRIVCDVIEFCMRKMPKFNPISISGYHIHEAGANLETEVAYTIADGIEYVRYMLKRGIDIDEFAGRLSFFFAIGKNLFEEIAKLRAARTLWAHYMKKMGARDPASMRMRIHCQTSGWSLVAQDPYNNIIRTTFEALAAVLGGTQSLHTNSYDEAIALPSYHSSLIALRTQTILQKETDICKCVDPFGGSYLIESLTSRIIQSASKIIDDIEREGGMLKALMKGIPQYNIERMAIQRQLDIDTGKYKIVGLNYMVAPYPQPIFELMEISNEEVLAIQKQKIEKVKRERDNDRVSRALDKLEEVCRTGNGNILECAIEAARARATLGEISTAMENVFGRYQAPVRIITGEYSKISKEDPTYIQISENVKRFRTALGRNPSILISKAGQDGHTRGAAVISSAFADFGFDVILLPLFQTPHSIVKMAIENDVDAISVSSLAGSHLYFAREIVRLLREYAPEKTPVLIFGGIIPEKDIEKLKQIGIHLVFPSGTNVLTAGLHTIKLINEIMLKKEGVR